MESPIARLAGALLLLALFYWVLLVAHVSPVDPAAVPRAEVSRAVAEAVLDANPNHQDARAVAERTRSNP